jgi:hypothetical protein
MAVEIPRPAPTLSILTGRKVRADERDGTAVTGGGASNRGGENLEPANTPPGIFLDKIRLIVVALLACIIGVAAFVVSQTYHVNSYWLFFALGSVGMVPLLFRNYRTLTKRPAFFLFLTCWVVLHGFIVASLIHRISLVFWIPVFALELLVGYLTAFWLFGVVPSDEIQDSH